MVIIMTSTIIHVFFFFIDLQFILSIYTRRDLLVLILRHHSSQLAAGLSRYLAPSGNKHGQMRVFVDKTWTSSRSRLELLAVRFLWQFCVCVKIKTVVLQAACLGVRSFTSWSQNWLTLSIKYLAPLLSKYRFIGTTWILVLIIIMSTNNTQSVFWIHPIVRVASGQFLQKYLWFAPKPDTSANDRNRCFISNKTEEKKWKRNYRTNSNEFRHHLLTVKWINFCLKQSSNKTNEEVEKEEEPETERQPNWVWDIL